MPELRCINSCVSLLVPSGRRVEKCAAACLQGYAPLYNPFEQFYSRYVYRRVRHIFNRPICSTPGAEVTLKERATDDYNWSFRFTGTEKRCINLGSYNYLGFASPSGECADAAEAAARR
ncbi:jg24941, partial [Pararge aegeria aegeria]